MLITVAAFIVILGVLIFVHELGHFLTAKLVDIEVPRFSIGFGPRLIGFKKGETEYVISLLPLGGYVKMAGMEEMEVIEGKERHTEPAGVVDVGVLSAPASTPVRGPRDFESKPLPARALVISAGVLMNVLFAWLVYTVSALAWGVEPPEPANLAQPLAAALPAGARALASVPSGTRILGVGDTRVRNWSDVARALETAPAGPIAVRFQEVPPVTITLPADARARKELLHALQPVQEPVVGGIQEGSAAEQAGLRPGDRILAAAGAPIRYWQDLVRDVQPHAGQPITLTVQRGGAPVQLTATPRAASDTLPSGTVRSVGRLGIVPVMPAPVRPGLGGAVTHGARETWRMIALVLKFLKDMVTGHQSPRNLGGPIMIFQISGQVARAGLQTFLAFLALFSVNLAVLNLLPIPVLDGGHLLFIGIEAVRGRALTLEQRSRLMQVGFVLVVALMVWAVANDVLRLFGV
jgi:regulator of sigma E protease